MSEHPAAEKYDNRDQIASVLPVKNKMFDTLRDDDDEDHGDHAEPYTGGVVPYTGGVVAYTGGVVPYTGGVVSPPGTQYYCTLCFMMHLYTPNNNL